MRPGQESPCLRLVLVDIEREAHDLRQPSQPVAFLRRQPLLYGLLPPHQRGLGQQAVFKLRVSRRHHPRQQIGRASWRERGCQSGEISVVAVSLKKKTTKINTTL